MSNIIQNAGLADHEFDWRLNGSCRGTDTELFYGGEGERGRTRTEREKRAKAICRNCPVIAPCRRYALSANERFGVWGGLSESERRGSSARSSRTTGA